MRTADSERVPIANTPPELHVARGGSQDFSSYPKKRPQRASVGDRQSQCFVVQFRSRIPTLFRMEGGEEKQCVPSPLSLVRRKAGVLRKKLT